MATADILKENKYFLPNQLIPVTTTDFYGTVYIKKKTKN